MSKLIAIEHFFSDGSIVRAEPEPAGPAGELIDLKRRDECVIYDSRYAANNSFSMIGGRGADDWIQLGAKEIDFVFSIPDNLALKNWAATVDKGTLYTFRDDIARTMRWPIILLSSTYTNKQPVRVLDERLEMWGGVPRTTKLVDAIPYQASGDYSAYTPDRHPEFWLWAWTCFANGTYGVSHTFPDGRALTFRMPLWAPLTFPKISTTAREIGGLWIDARLFAEPVL